tara:strand:+ start:761 stop:940 length:180 start_codon:yes stop_codon:yes gene_type:complete
MANGDKYKSKKQLKKEGLMEKGGGIPSRPSWKNRMHQFIKRYMIPEMEITKTLGKKKKL